MESFGSLYKKSQKKNNSEIRMKRILILILILYFFFTTCQQGNVTYPKLTGPVMDPSGYLPLETKVKLENLLLTEEKITTNQVVVYITEKLKEDSIEKEATAVFEQWKLGQKDKDNGILLLLAPNDRKVRIEVGYGLEGILTDLVAKRIIDELIVPNMKIGNPSLAMLSGTSAILEQLRVGSPKLFTDLCPNSFNDLASDLHPDTIPFLKKEVKTLKTVNFYFCVVPVENQIGLEAAANQLFLKNQTKDPEKKTIVFVSSPNNNFIGHIITSPEFHWSLSQAKARSIFFSKYEERRSSDFTNFTYRAFLDMLECIKHNQKIVLEKGTGIYDPYDVLASYSYDKAGEIIRNLETQFHVGIQILFLDTKSDISLEAKKYHTIAFGNNSGITLLYSLNQKQVFVYTDTNSVIQNPNTKPIDNQFLSQSVSDAIAPFLKLEDIDWMCIRSAEAIDYYLHMLHTQPNENEANHESASGSPPRGIDNAKEPHVVFQWYMIIMFLVILVGMMAGEGYIFFYGVFYLGSVILRAKYSLLPESPNLYSIVSVVLVLLPTTIVVHIFRKIGWSDSVSSYSQDIFSGSSGGSSSSGSSYRSSSSSYSGGGGSSGGGGASGSW